MIETLVEFNLVITLVYLGYLLFLKRLTYFEHIRTYFLLGISSTLFFTLMKSIYREYYKKNFTHEVNVPFSLEVQTVDYSSYWVYALGLGSLVFFVKILISLFQIFRIHTFSLKENYETKWYQNVRFEVAPFSFFRWIYIHKKSHSRDEFEQIYIHEKVHVNGLHSVDVLLTQIIVALAWYNPIVWLMKNHVIENLEYLTDELVLDEGVNKKMYQYSLLKVASKNTSQSAGNHFNMNFIKKRILMMNKPRSEGYQSALFMILIPIFMSLNAFVSLVPDSVLEIEAKEGFYLLNASNYVRPAIKQDSIDSGYVITLPVQNYENAGSSYIVKATRQAGTLRVIP